MVFVSDIPEHSMEKYQSQYSSIYDELTKMYNRFDVTTEKDLKDYPEADENTLRVAQILDSYWDIPIDLTLSDFETETIRKKENQMETPDISTYQMRFAIEEGAWIVMLRSYFPNLLKGHVSKLEKLEELIWNSSRAVEEDYAFYLIELESVTKLWLNPFQEYWLSEHDFSKPKDFALRLSGSIYNVNNKRGMGVYEGGQRLFLTKMEDLQKITEMNRSSSPWLDKAYELYKEISKRLLLSVDEPTLIPGIITIIYVHRSVNTKYQQKTTSGDSYESGNQNITQKIGFDQVDLADDDSVGEFIDAILLALYDLPEENPLKAARYILQSLFTELNTHDVLKNEILDQLTKQIELNTSSIEDLVEKQREIVNTLETLLPKLIIRIKEGSSQTRAAQQKHDFDQLEIWDLYFSQLQRIMRSKESSVRLENLKKAVKTVYNYLIDKRIEPLVIIENIFEKSTLSKLVLGLEISELTSKFENEIRVKLNEKLSPSDLDKYLIERISEELFEKL